MTQASKSTFSLFGRVMATAALTAGLMAAPVSAAPKVVQDETYDAMFIGLKNRVRPEEEVRRDPERRPIETMQFFGLKPDMTVVELIPGAGWYTKVLGHALKKEGKLYVGLSTDRVEGKLEEWALPDVELISKETEFKESDIRHVYDLENINLDVKNVDMVLTFRNAHNLTPKARAELNKEVFDALKPGGIYGVVDHTRRHNQPYTRPVWRRLDPVLVIKEALDAGFEFVDFSDVHYYETDNLQLDTRDEKFEGPSDRFTLKFRKPL